jgi:hypothetical protein
MPARRQTLNTQHPAVKVRQLAVVAERDRPHRLARSGQCDDGIGRAEINADRAGGSHIALPRIGSGQVPVIHVHPQNRPGNGMRGRLLDKDKQPTDQGATGRTRLTRDMNAGASAAGMRATAFCRTAQNASPARCTISRRPRSPSGRRRQLKVGSEAGQPSRNSGPYSGNDLIKKRYATGTFRYLTS